LYNCKEASSERLGLFFLRAFHLSDSTSTIFNRPSPNRNTSNRMNRLFQIIALPCLLLAQSANARAILGVDLGSLYMKVALVQSGSPLEIVTNLHSKRKTEQMILFDQNQRFYGADAASLLARKSHQTPAAMSVLLGRDEEHPIVQVRHCWLH
jgi:hypothetical protein